MTVSTKGFAAGACPPGAVRQQCPGASEGWRSYAHRRLTAVLAQAVEVPFDSTSRLVFLSDSHRGDGGRTDAFARNRDLFLHVLGRYYDQGYAYVEVGDGDELWKSWRFEDVLRAHAPVFDLLHRFDREDRLHLVVGNHDRRNGRRDTVDKDGLIGHEGLVLQHTRTGQQLFVVHGHQADLASDYLSRASRLVVGYFWRRLQLMGLAGVSSQMSHIWKLNLIERAIMGWAGARQQITICGHTHRPMSAVHGEAPYFNTGSCSFPGCITGLELANGEISLVSWNVRGSARPGRVLRIERQIVAPPRKLCALA